MSYSYVFMQKSDCEGIRGDGGQSLKDTFKMTEMNSLLQLLDTRRRER